ncbi:MAG: hypothetical protein J0I06_02445 [Planctomycetes bacterium]|nr:hypothetical protein [Planctomycetota bacterium]
MRRLFPFLCLVLVGCNAPGAAFLDSCFPSRAKTNPAPEPGPGVDVRPVDPIRPGPPAPPGPNPPIPPPDFGPGS